MLRLHTLGELRLLDETGESLGGARKELVLLAYLAFRAPAPVPRPELATLLWGEREERRARHSLRQALLELKRLVGPALEVTPETVRVEAGAVELDVMALTAEMAEGRLADAVGRAGGELLAGLEDLGSPAYRQWLEEHRADLGRQLEWALERLAADAQRRGEWSEMASWAERWTRLAPLAERPHALQMEALERDGRAAEALGCHSRLIARLQELEIAPTPEFVQLGEQIQRRGRLRPVLGPSPGSAALFSPDLVGRDEALGEVEVAWRAVRGGVSAVLVIEGEPGMGKTRVCEEFLRGLAATSEPHVVLRARGVAAPPWATARELLSDLRTAPGLSGAPDRALAELSLLVPSLRERFPALPEPEGGEPTRANALGQVLGDVAVEAPVVLFVDDAQAADAESRRLLLALAQQPPVSGLLVLLTLDRWEATSPFAPLRRAQAVRQVRLLPLDAEEVDALVASMLACPETERAELSRRLHAETGGNPFFAAEMVSTMVDEGRLAPGSDGYWHIRTVDIDSTLPLPASVREAIRRRLERLDEPARKAVVAAAGMVERFPPEALATAADASPERGVAAVEELLGRRLLRRSSSGDGSLEFSHPLVRRTALELAEAPAHPEPGAGGNALAAVGPVETARGRRRARVRRTAVSPMAVAAATALVLLGGLVRHCAGTAAAPPLWAVGLIRGSGVAGDFALDQVLQDMLATRLGRVHGLRVLSREQLYGSAEPRSSGGPTEAELTAAARALGATEILEGEVRSGTNGRLRLDLRRLDLASGRVRAAYTAEGSDVFELADRATAQIAGELHEQL